MDALPKTPKLPIVTRRAAIGSLAAAAVVSAAEPSLVVEFYGTDWTREAEYRRVDGWLAAWVTFESEATVRGFRVLVDGEAAWEFTIPKPMKGRAGWRLPLVIAEPGAEPDPESRERAVEIAQGGPPPVGGSAIGLSPRTR